MRIKVRGRTRYRAQDPRAASPSEPCASGLDANACGAGSLDRVGCRSTIRQSSMRLILERFARSVGRVRLRAPPRYLIACYRVGGRREIESNSTTQQCRSVISVCGHFELGNCKLTPPICRASRRSRQRHVRPLISAGKGEVSSCRDFLLPRSPFGGRRSTIPDSPANLRLYIRGIVLDLIGMVTRNPHCHPIPDSDRRPALNVNMSTFDSNRGPNQTRQDWVFINNVIIAERNKDARGWTRESVTAGAVPAGAGARGRASYVRVTQTIPPCPPVSSPR
ncbi:hypothetical protein EVAR_74648_1 [Eumeta japonica]|uniref:Uncharacterized protein n=1 Tax=Eumeta variegata TaxID=151549 RepID=A0A4C1WAR2_EUMVA|nr:hypothetical protein EVAR_74648_1 [Eumeta japonica]